MAVSTSVNVGILAFRAKDIYTDRISGPNFVKGRTFGCGLFYCPFSMSETLDLPVALAAAPFDTVGATVGSVVKQISRALRRTEIEPEWVTHANFIDEDCPDRFGLGPSAPWPVEQSTRRVSLAVGRGNSEGWIIGVDVIELVTDGESQLWKSVPLIRIKSLSRSQAWSIAAVVSRLLDID